MSVCAIIEVTKFKLAIKMAEALQQVLFESTSTKKRKSYSREEKLKVVKFYHDYQKNLYKILDQLEDGDALGER